jgi:glycosyltransferase involved in cell wall biosynthesis
MRSIYVLNSIGTGGTERQVLALADRMRARGHVVALMVLLPASAGDLETSLDVIHLDITKKVWGLFRAQRRASQFVRDFKPDLLHSHNFLGNILARLLRLRHREPCLVSTIHNVYEGGWHRMLSYRLSDPLAKRTTAVSRAVAERYTRNHAVPVSKCIVITNGIDVDRFTPDPQRRAEIRAQMGVSSEFIWMSAGRIVPAKDYPNLLHAFARVHAAYPAAQLWIAGESAITGRKEYFVVATEKGVMDRVRWLGLRRDVPALLDAADGFVLSSAWEGMPLALGEAMAMQKLCAATDVGGVRELAGAAAAIVPPRDPAELAAAMLTAMNAAPEVRQMQGDAARERIRTQFSMNARADEWESLYRNLLA